MRKVCHGSRQVVAQPDVQARGHYKDFGFGFYCTEIREQAIKFVGSEEVYDG